MVLYGPYNRDFEKIMFGRVVGYDILLNTLTQGNVSSTRISSSEPSI
jgi:hypothetical protein